MSTHELARQQSSFSIRYKILLVISFLLFACVSAYLYLAVSFFKQDKVNLVFEYNKTSVERLAAEIDRFFSNSMDTVDLVAQSSLRKGQQILKGNSHIVLYGELSKDFDNLYIDKDFFKTYGLSPDQIKKEVFAQRAEIDSYVQKQKDSLWPFQNQWDIPLVSLGRIVMIPHSGKAQIKRVFALVKPNELAKSLFQSNELSELFVTNEEGRLLVGQPKNWSQKSLARHPLFETAKQSQVKTGVKTLEWNKQEYLGAFSMALNSKAYVFSQTNKNIAFYSVQRFIFRSTIFAAIVAVSAFIAAILFSKSLTRPLSNLLKGIQKVSQGDLDVEIAISSRDEINVLANSFNSMIKDIKSSRTKLLKAKEELEDKVKERTIQLEVQNQAVKKSQEALLKNTRLAAIGEVAGQAAHEVLNPLTNIMTRLEKVSQLNNEQQAQDLELLHCITQGWSKSFSDPKGLENLVEEWKKPSTFYPDKILFEEDLENLKLVHESFENYFHDKNNDIGFLIKEAQRINKIVSGMRSLSTVKGELREYSIVALVQDSVNVMADMADEHHIQISISSLADEDYVLVDEYEFVQVMTNLIRNSLQSIHEKQKSFSDLEGLVQINVYKREEKINIEVQDNGSGIPLEHRDKLFSSQFTTKSPEKGTGIGLSISRRFIRQFSGDLSLKDSQISRGSVFLIQLPVSSTMDRRVG